MSNETQTIVVTGANGLVGAAVCRALSARGASVRAVVRRAGAAPELPGVTEVVGEFHDPTTSREIVAGADAVVNTVHPMLDDDLQDTAVAWAEGLATAARDAGVQRFVHTSSTSVYERIGSTGDVDESSKLVTDDADDYSRTKRATDEGVARVDGITRVIVRPTAILGASQQSVWNTRRPAGIREDGAVTDDPERTFGWVHVDDLAALIADIATGAIALTDNPAAGPVDGGVTCVNAVSGTVPMRDYVEPVATAVGVTPTWEERDAFRADLRADRARAWGWSPKVTFEDAMRELLDGLR